MNSKLTIEQVFIQYKFNSLTLHHSDLILEKQMTWIYNSSSKEDYITFIRVIISTKQVDNQMKTHLKIILLTNFLEKAREKFETSKK